MIFKVIFIDGAVEIVPAGPKILGHVRLDQIRFGFFQSIGIQRNKPFAPDARMKKILNEAADVRDATARTILSILAIGPPTCAYQKLRRQPSAPWKN